MPLISTKITVVPVRVICATATVLSEPDGAISGQKGHRSSMRIRRDTSPPGRAPGRPGPATASCRPPLATLGRFPSISGAGTVSVSSFCVCFVSDGCPSIPGAGTVSVSSICVCSVSDGCAPTSQRSRAAPDTFQGSGRGCPAVPGPFHGTRRPEGSRGGGHSWTPRP